MAEKSYVERSRERDLANKREQRAAARDIEIPPIKDKRRRAKCAKSIPLFAKTYFPDLFYLDWASYQLDILERAQRRIIYGGNEAIAAPRGGGKDRLFLAALVWGICYGHIKSCMYVGPNYEEAEKKVQYIKDKVEGSDLLCEDFPEVVVPARSLERAAQRGKTQTVNGEYTYIEWGAGNIKFATVKGSLASGAEIIPAGIDGGIRGKSSDFRPDLVCINDLETDDAARSVTQRKTNEGKIDKAIAGLRGPGKRIAKFMLCTIACEGCLSQKYTDPTIKPAWNGHRYKALVEPPAHMEMWEQYWALRKEGQSDGFMDDSKGEKVKDPYGRRAHAFYLENREQMDKGAVVAWEYNFESHELDDGTQNEVSALQHIMNEWCDNGDEYFFAELQNEPLDETNAAAGLTVDLITRRLSGYEPFIVPPDVKFVIEGIDVGVREIHSTILGVNESGSSYVLEYARIKTDAPDTDLHSGTMSDSVREAAERAVLGALQARRDNLRDRFENEREDSFRRPDGTPVGVDLHLVDGGYFPRVIHKFCRESGETWRFTRGLGTLTNQKRWAMPVATKGIRRGFQYYGAAEKDSGRICWWIHDDYFKEYTQLRFLQDVGTDGSCTLWGSDPRLHRTYARHIMAEKFDVEAGKWVKVSNFNHWLDSTKLAHCGAIMKGIRLKAILPEDAPKQTQNGRADEKPVRGKVAPPRHSGERVFRKKRERAGAW